MYKPLELVDAQELLLTPLDVSPFLVEDMIPVIKKQLNVNTT